jgi:proteic killer suppression protein
MIRSFRCRDTARLFADEDVPRFGSVARVARRKLIYLDAATAVGDLRVPPATDLRR